LICVPSSQLWSVKPSGSQKKLPVVTYLNSLSYHSSAVNVIRFSSSGKLISLIFIEISIFFTVTFDCYSKKNYALCK